MQLKCYSVAPRSKVITNSTIRLFCLGIVEWAHFDKFIMIVIIANALALCTVWPSLSDDVFYPFKLFSSAGKPNTPIAVAVASSLLCIWALA